MFSPSANRREFKWCSSTTGPSERLQELEKQMAALYASDEVRSHYEPICFAARDSQPAVSGALTQQIVQKHPSTVLEVGCGSAWLAQRIIAAGLPESAYHGVDMEAGLIKNNTATFPNAHFAHGSVYSLPFTDESYDVVFAHFVLEHCVYPECALNEMIRVLKPRGSLFLVFPDFPELGVLPSQWLGLREGNAKALLQQGRIFAALVALYDSRIRLRKALLTVVAKYGPFPVNVAPKCLEDGRIAVPDADAVYISSKSEVANWAISKRHHVLFPSGTAGPFQATAFVEIQKSVS